MSEACRWTEIFGEQGPSRVQLSTTPITTQRAVMNFDKPFQYISPSTPVSLPFLTPDLETLRHL